MSLLRRHFEVHKSLPPGAPPLRNDLTYSEVKHSSLARFSDGKYQEVKAAVREGPFKGWLVSGAKWESFDMDGVHRPD